MTGRLVGRSTGWRSIIGTDADPAHLMPSVKSGSAVPRWCADTWPTRAPPNRLSPMAACTPATWARCRRRASWTLRGRIKELINRGGEKISPERVEGVLASHPKVVEAAVFGVPDELYGETVGAAVVPDQSDAPTADELTEFCRERLAAFEVPAGIALTDELPHTAKGSIDRRAVVERFGKGD